MRCVFTLSLLLLAGFSADAQKLTGIWRGYFSSANEVTHEARGEMYKYELQIDQQSNNAVKGVTYSYKSTVFYGKADVKGIFTASTNSLIVKELKLVELKVAGQSEPCLMTCYLDYSKIGKMEFLQGTFISTNAKDKGDCGSGKVYLEKVPTSDFKKEDFLDKMKDIDTSGNLPDNKKASGTKPSSNKPSTNPPLKQPATLPPPVTGARPPAPKNLRQPGAAKPSAAIKPKADKGRPHSQPNIPDRIPEASVTSPRVDTVVPGKQENAIHKMHLPKVLTERENSLVKTIIVDEEDVQIDLYDNGSIDHDTISVYHNNVLVVSRREINYTPITIKFKCSKADNRHEIIVVAENLGEIPPNSAAMIINSRSKKHYEVFLTSTEEKNAKVVIEYRPKE